MENAAPILPSTIMLDGIKFTLNKEMLRHIPFGHSISTLRFPVRTLGTNLDHWRFEVQVFPNGQFIRSEKYINVHVALVECGDHNLTGVWLEQSAMVQVTLEAELSTHKVVDWHVRTFHWRHRRHEFARMHMPAACLLTEDNVQVKIEFERIDTPRLKRSSSQKIIARREKIMDSACLSRSLVAYPIRICSLHMRLSYSFDDRIEMESQRIDASLARRRVIVEESSSNSENPSVETNHATTSQESVAANTSMMQRFLNEICCKKPTDDDDSL